MIADLADGSPYLSAEHRGRLRRAGRSSVKQAPLANDATRGFVAGLEQTPAAALTGRADRVRGAASLFGS